MAKGIGGKLKYVVPTCDLYQICVAQFVVPHEPVISLPSGIETDWAVDYSYNLEQSFTAQVIVAVCF